ncbi:MAG: MBL fold metallo-hydrolase [Acidimicrobiales bacterium]|nr:MBL fold metallo-hydrolase [Acidimicrobiales bacterium]
MQVRIHRGTREIGGSCIEVENNAKERIVLDVGRPLWAGWGEEVPPPSVAGFAEPDPSLLAVVISHPHADHYGLLDGVTADVPVYIGREAGAVLNAAAFFSPVSATIDPAGHLEHRTPFAIGGFTITPFLNDHSAFDAYSMVIEADGQRLFYSGDIRGHGRKAKLFEQLLNDPPVDIDTLLMEGTHVRADGSHDELEYETEADLEERFVEMCENTTGAVVVFGSAQNLDRLVTVFRAGRRSRRQTVIDLYGATVAAATRDSIPQPGFDGLRVYVPNRQRVRVKEAAEFERVAWITDHRVFLEEVAANPGNFIFHVPSSTDRELLKAGVLSSNSAAAWSLWDGYLKDGSGKSLRQRLADNKVPFTSVHTSGHASVKDLQRLVAALDPDKVVPIHSEATDRYDKLFPNVELHADGDLWEVQ